MGDFQVRPAVTADAEAIVRTHHDAVWRTARTHYPPETLAAWAVKLTDDSCERVRREIADTELVVLVAESHSRVAGFGMIVPAGEELRKRSMRSTATTWSNARCIACDREMKWRVS